MRYLVDVWDGKEELPRLGKQVSDACSLDFGCVTPYQESLAMLVWGFWIP